MMTTLTSISKAGVLTVPPARSTDAIGAALRRAYAGTPMPDDMVALLQQIDRRSARH